MAIWLNRMVEKAAPLTDGLKVDADWRRRIPVDARGRATRRGIARARREPGAAAAWAHVLRPFVGEGLIEVLRRSATAANGTYGYRPTSRAGAAARSLVLTEGPTWLSTARAARRAFTAERASLLGREQVFDPVEGDAVPLRWPAL